MDSTPIEFTIDGRNVSPQSVALRDLLDLLSLLDQAIDATAKSRGIVGLPSVYLVGVADGSDVMLLEANEQAVFAAKEIAAAIETGDCTKIPLQAERCLRGMWKKAKANEWSLGLSNSHFSATISPTEELFAKSQVKGATSLWGRLIRVGGAGPTAALVLEQFMAKYQTITIDLDNEEMAKELGHHLYETVGLEGEATWSVPGWGLDQFKARSILPFSKSEPDAVAAFRAIRDISGAIWDDVDPDIFVGEQR